MKSPTARLAAALLATGLAAPVSAGEAIGASPARLTLTGSPVGGPDANANGVRDDVDGVIASLKLRPTQAKALEAYARSLQGSLAVGATSQVARVPAGLADPVGSDPRMRQDVLALAISTSSAINCLERATTGQQSVGATLAAVHRATVNTVQRESALASFELALEQANASAIAAPRPRCA